MLGGAHPKSPVSHQITPPFWSQIPSNGSIVSIVVSVNVMRGQTWIYAGAAFSDVNIPAFFVIWPISWYFSFQTSFNDEVKSLGLSHIFRLSIFRRHVVQQDLFSAPVGSAFFCNVLSESSCDGSSSHSHRPDPQGRVPHSLTQQEACWCRLDWGGLLHAWRALHQVCSRLCV